MQNICKDLMFVNKIKYYKNTLGLKIKCRNIENWVIMKILSKSVDYD